MNLIHSLCRVMLFTLFLCTFPVFGSAGEEDLADPGQITFRSQISTLDFEEIDPYSGTLSLTHKDVSLPGNGGLDLNLYRTYRIDHSTGYTVLGARWEMHLGRIKKNGDNHIAIELQDGTVNSAVKENYDSALGFFYNYYTKDFWKVNMQGTPTLQLTDGTEIVFGIGGTGTYDDWYYATEIRKNNNTITIHYNLNSRRMSYLTDSTGRRINFTYQYIGDTYRLASINCTQDPQHRNLVNYSYSGTGATSVLQSVTYPDGDAWSYGYDLFIMESGQIRKNWISTINTPYGGTIVYDYSSFKRADVLMGYKYQLSVSEKTVSGSGLTTGTWTYNYLITTKVQLEKKTSKVLTL